MTTHDWDDPPELLRTMADSLASRYGLDLPSISASLYHDGHDSVAWHGDRIGRARRADRRRDPVARLTTPVPAAAEGGRGSASIRYVPASGDLLVLGGTCQRTWEHTVPKCADAGPRISVMFRESY